MGEREISPREKKIVTWFFLCIIGFVAFCGVLVFFGMFYQVVLQLGVTAFTIYFVGALVINANETKKAKQK